MSVQEISVIILSVGAVIYLVRYFIRLNKAHKCDDCGLMNMKKESDQKKKNNN